MADSTAAIPWITLQKSGTCRMLPIFSFQIWNMICETENKKIALWHADCHMNIQQRASHETFPAGIFSIPQCQINGIILISALRMRQKAGWQTNAKRKRLQLPFKCGSLLGVVNEGVVFLVLSAPENFLNYFLSAEHGGSHKMFFHSTIVSPGCHSSLLMPNKDSEAEKYWAPGGSKIAQFRTQCSPAGQGSVSRYHGTFFFVGWEFSKKILNLGVSELECCPCKQDFTKKPRVWKGGWCAGMWGNLRTTMHILRFSAYFRFFCVSVFAASTPCQYFQFSYLIAATQCHHSLLWC